MLANIQRIMHIVVNNELNKENYILFSNRAIVEVRKYLYL